jgi:hypothetical protein
MHIQLSKSVVLLLIEERKHFYADFLQKRRFMSELSLFVIFQTMVVF